MTPADPDLDDLAWLMRVLARPLRWLHKLLTGETL
jgi:hypothetical protein